MAVICIGGSSFSIKSKQISIEVCFHFNSYGITINFLRKLIQRDATIICEIIYGKEYNHMKRILYARTC